MILVMEVWSSYQQLLYTVVHKVRPTVFLYHEMIAIILETKSIFHYGAM